jgi:hypothetical protein
LTSSADTDDVFMDEAESTSAAVWLSGSDRCRRMQVLSSEDDFDEIEDVRGAMDRRQTIDLRVCTSGCGELADIMEEPDVENPEQPSNQPEPAVGDRVTHVEVLAEDEPMLVVKREMLDGEKVCDGRLKRETECAKNWSQDTKIRLDNSTIDDLNSSCSSSCNEQNEKCLSFVPQFNNRKKRAVGNGSGARQSLADSRPLHRQRKSLGSPESVETSSGTKSHHCPVCRRAFSRTDMLERHARLHTGVRPYACRLCPQVFSRSDHLTTHLRTHTGEKPYSCPRCAYSASRRDMVTRHLRVHMATGSDPSAPGPIGLALGPSRRRTYRTRYRIRPSLVADNVNDNSVGDQIVTSSTVTSMPSVRELGWSLPNQDHSVASDSTVVSTAAFNTRRWSRARLLAGLDIHDLSLGHQDAVTVTRGGSTGSMDSYSSPSLIGSASSASAERVFEFDTASPDVFRSPSSTARHTSRFLWPFVPSSPLHGTAASTSSESSQAS